MLTVMRDMAAPSRASSRTCATPGCGRGGRRGQNAVIADILERALAEGEQSVKRGPELLPILEAGRRRRRRLRRHRHLRRGHRRAARHAAPELEHHAPGAHQPPPSRVGDLPLLHELRGQRRRPGAAGFIEALEASGTPCWSSATSHAEGPRPHRRPRGGDRRLRRGGRGLAPGRRRHARPGRRTASARLAASAGGAAGAHALRGARCRPAARACTSCSARSAPVSSTAARRSTRRRRAAGRHPRRARRRGRRPAQQPERDHDRRARGRAVREGRARRRRALQQAGLGAAVALDQERRRRSNAAAMRRPSRPAHGRRRARRARGRRRALRGRRRRRLRRGRDRRVGPAGATLGAVLAALADDAELITCIAGDGAPLEPTASPRSRPAGSSWS